MTNRIDPLAHTISATVSFTPQGKDEPTDWFLVEGDANEDSIKTEALRKAIQFMSLKEASAGEYKIEEVSQQWDAGGLKIDHNYRVWYNMTAKTERNS